MAMNDIGVECEWDDIKEGELFAYCDTDDEVGIAQRLQGDAYLDIYCPDEPRFNGEKAVMACEFEHYYKLSSPVPILTVKEDKE